MERSFTNRALGVGGDANTTSVTVRLPKEVVEHIDTYQNGQIKNRSEYLQHWAQVGMKVMSDPELSDALDWALSEPRAGEPDGQAPACKAEESGSTPEPASEPDDTVAEVVPPEPVQTDELTTLRESQLEALRSRVH